MIDLNDTEPITLSEQSNTIDVDADMPHNEDNGACGPSPPLEEAPDLVAQLLNIRASVLFADVEDSDDDDDGDQDRTPHPESEISPGHEQASQTGKFTYAACVGSLN